MFQSTTLLLDGTASPRGNCQMTPAPWFAGRAIPRKKFAGTVGPVAHARADCTFEGRSFTPLSFRNVTGLVGVTPIAAGLPRPMVVSVAAFREKPISRSLNSLVPARISHAAFAVVTFVVSTR